MATPIRVPDVISRADLVLPVKNAGLKKLNVCIDRKPKDPFSLCNSSCKVRRLLFVQFVKMLRFNLLLFCAELVLGIRQLYLGLRDI